MKKSYPSLYKSAFVIFVLLIPFYSVKSQSKLWNISLNTGGDQFGSLYAVSGNGSNFEQHDIIGVSVFMPVGELVQCPNGKAYGIANRGGRYNNGAIFEYDYNSNIYTKKIDLESTITGVEPEAGMTLASNGKLYGTMKYEGTYGSGVIFEYDFINNIFTKKVELGDGSGFNGFWPGSVLLQASNGKLYGITLQGGTSASANDNTGVVFEYDYNSNIYTERIALHDITGDNFGGKSSLMQASNGKIYGITGHGGNSQNSSGIIFEYDYNTNTYSKKFDFDAFNFGGATTPYGILRQAPDGKLYGTASAFSPNGCIFSYDYTSNTYTKLASFPAPTGQLTSFEKRYLFS